MVVGKDARPVPRVRSALYIPGHRAYFLAKADQRGADAVILDLEDAVAGACREKARRIASEWIASRPDPRRPLVCVRINGLGEGWLERDLEAVVGPNLTAVLVPKVRSATDVKTVAEALDAVETAIGIERGHVRIWPLVETVAAVRSAFEIASASPRVAYMGGATAEGGDLAHDLGFQWTVEGLETLYLRSKVLLDVRAAGVQNPMTGLVARVDDLAAVEAFARQGRQLGYAGCMVIHPAHVEIVNRTFSPTPEEVRQAKEILAALKAAEAAGGDLALTYRGRMIDKAMIHIARQLLEDARRLGVVSA